MQLLVGYKKKEQSRNRQDVEEIYRDAEIYVLENDTVMGNTVIPR